MLLTNALRWFRENLLRWLVLGSIYAVTLGVVLQPFLEKILETRVSVARLGAIVLGLIGAATLLERVRGYFGFFSAPLRCSSLARLYLAHQFRRINPWLTVVIAGASVMLFPEGHERAWAFAVQILVQRELMSVQRWRNLVHFAGTADGPGGMLEGLWVSQGWQAAAAWMLAAICGLGFGVDSWEIAAAALGGAMAGISVAWEGDAGRPGLVNFISLAAGCLATAVCLGSPWALLAVAYFAAKCRGLAANRFKSVDSFHEDFVIP
ncbi:MAG: hypothetical protein AB7P04_03945 [Bacteriovoracia bacterium]